MNFRNTALLSVFIAAAAGFSGFRLGTRQAPPAQDCVAPAPAPTPDKTTSLSQDLAALEELMDLYCQVSLANKLAGEGLNFPLTKGAGSVNVSSKGVKVFSPEENLSCLIGPAPENPKNVSIRCDKFTPAP